MAERYESKNRTIETANEDLAAQKARADALDKANDKLTKDLEAVRADNAARDPVAARQRRMQRHDARGKSTTGIYREDAIKRTDMGVGLGLGTKAGHPTDDAAEPNSDDARARRIARTTR